MRLPEDDDEESLHQSAKPSEGLNVREEERIVEESKDTYLKYLIVAGLMVVLIIILFNSSHKKVRIVYTSPMDGKEVKRMSGGNNLLNSQHNPVKQNGDMVKKNVDAELEKEKIAKEKVLRLDEELSPPVASTF